MLTAKNEIISGIYTEYLSYESSSDLNIITHDFCVNPDQCEIVAEKIVNYLNIVKKRN